MTTSTLDDVSQAAFGLIRDLAGTHKRWVQLNLTENGLTERLATYVALKAMIEAFDVSGILADPGEIVRLDELAAAFELHRGPIEPQTGGMA